MLIAHHLVKGPLPSQAWNVLKIKAQKVVQKILEILWLWKQLMRPLQEERELEEGTHQKSTSSFEKWKPKDRSIELSKLFSNTQIYKYKNPHHNWRNAGLYRRSGWKVSPEFTNCLEIHIYTFTQHWYTRIHKYKYTRHHPHLWKWVKSVNWVNCLQIHKYTFTQSWNTQIH